jgi:hypothetical protein
MAGRSVNSTALTRGDLLSLIETEATQSALQFFRQQRAVLLHGLDRGFAHDGGDRGVALPRDDIDSLDQRVGLPGGEAIVFVAVAARRGARAFGSCRLDVAHAEILYFESGRAFAASAYVAAVKESHRNKPLSLSIL